MSYQSTRPAIAASLARTSGNPVTYGAARPAHAADVPPAIRTLLVVLGALMMLVIAYALARAALGLAPSPAWARASIREVAIIVHIVTVVPAIPLGLYIFTRRKGDARHRSLGKLWLSLLVVTAIASLFIRHLNPGSFSPIHILSLLTLVGAWRSIDAARRGQIDKHRRIALSMFVGTLLVAGLFTFVPAGCSGCGRLPRR